MKEQWGDSVAKGDNEKVDSRFATARLASDVVWRGAAEVREGISTGVFTCLLV